ncbi:hypothetical protein [Pseudooceanicola sp.]|uniref:hypothetical protein n=1 Tax=Pseudooceanicola sp. TaxID=1914328 RepID=UPI0035C6DD98
MVQLVPTSPLAALLVLAILGLGPLRGSVLLFLTLPFDSAAAVNLRGLGSITLTDAAILALLGSVALRAGRGPRLVEALRPGQFGAPLVLLMAIVAIGAVFLPRIHLGGTQVYEFLRGADGAKIVLGPLRPTGGNIGQSVRMVLSVLAFLLMVTLFRGNGCARLAIRAMIAASAAHILLSLLDLLSPVIGSGVIGLLRTAMVNVLDNQVLLGVRRLIAGFAEPSSFGAFTIGLYGFWLRLWIGPRGDAIAGIMALVMGLLLVRSTSSAAYVSLALFTGVFLIWQARAVMASPRALRRLVILCLMLPALTGAVILVLNLVPLAGEMLDRIVFTKLQSQSGGERLSWNWQALTNLMETYGLGGGIGSVRASGWLFACLGNLGVVGTAIYLWFVGRILLARPPRERGPGQTAEVLAAYQTGCAAMLLQACMLRPYPDLGSAFFAMAGVAAGLVLHLRGQDSRVKYYNSRFSTVRQVCT